MEEKETFLKIVRDKNEEFRNLEKAHKEYEEQLEELDKIKFPSQEEIVEKNRIKKLKLQGKDRMEFLINDFKKKLSLNN